MIGGMLCCPKEKRYHWAIVIFIVALILLASGSWIYLTYYYFNAKCRDNNSYWFISLSVAVIIVISLTATTMLVVWVVYSYYTSDSSQPEGSQNVGIGGPDAAKSSQVPPMQQVIYGIAPPGSGIPGQVGAVYKSIHHPDGTYHPVAYGPISPMVAYDHSGSPMRSPFYPAPAQMAPVPVMAPSPSPSPLGQLTAAKKSSGGGMRKIGSDESTGSSYYQQLMKTKGGVKSISQYGELLKAQRKTKTRKQAGAQDQK